MPLSPEQALQEKHTMVQRLIDNHHGEILLGQLVDKVEVQGGHIVVTVFNSQAQNAVRSILTIVGAPEGSEVTLVGLSPLPDQAGPAEDADSGGKCPVDSDAAEAARAEAS